MVSASGRPWWTEASWIANRSRWRKSGWDCTVSRTLLRRRPSRMFHVQILTSSIYPQRTEFLELDYLYTPSDDVAKDARYFTDVLGGKLAFAVEGMGARVAMIELADGPPHVLLTDHLEGDRAICIYRVDDLRKAASALKRRGLRHERRLEIPIGPCSSFVLPGGHRMAIYEATRPGVLEHFVGRRDF